MLAVVQRQAKGRSTSAPVWQLLAVVHLRERSVVVQLCVVVARQVVSTGQPSFVRSEKNSAHHIDGSPHLATCSPRQGRTRQQVAATAIEAVRKFVAIIWPVQ